MITVSFCSTSSLATASARLALRGTRRLSAAVRSAIAQALIERRLRRDEEQSRVLLSVSDADSHATSLRRLIRTAAGVRPADGGMTRKMDLLDELAYLSANADRLKPLFARLRAKRVLYSGQCYYNSWYLSRELRDSGWRADVLNWDANPSSQIFYHGEDFNFTGGSPDDQLSDLAFFVEAAYRYDVFHFSNAWGMSFGGVVQGVLAELTGDYFGDVRLLKRLGKSIVYTNNGCLDGVSQSAFSRWGPESVCSICRWRREPSVCSDERNLEWGKLRNSLADFQCLLGGNRADYNASPTVHEVPEFYCLDADIWKPGLDIPAKWQLRDKPGAIRLYHAVGNRVARTDLQGVNIKSSHIYLPLIEKLVSEGTAVDLLEPTDIPNREVRFLQAQADIFLDMLTYGWFGANAREAMMLGKPVICFIRPEWLEDVRKEIPEYADDLPVVSATPQTVEAVLRDLIAHPEKRAEIGTKSRAFAVKWHSKEAGARRMGDVYTRLLKGDSQLLERYV